MKSRRNGWKRHVMEGYNCSCMCVERERETLHVWQLLHCRRLQCVAPQKHPSCYAAPWNLVIENQFEMNQFSTINDRESKYKSLRIDKITSICETFNFCTHRHKSSEVVTMQYGSQSTSWTAWEHSLFQKAEAIKIEGLKERGGGERVHALYA